MAQFTTDKYTIVRRPIRPENSPPELSVAWANHIRGGYHIVENEKEHGGKMIPDGVPEYQIKWDEGEQVPLLPPPLGPGGSETINQIPDANIRQEGLLCYVLSTGKTYRLVGGVTDDDWEEVDVGEMSAKGWVFPPVDTVVAEM